MPRSFLRPILFESFLTYRRTIKRDSKGGNETRLASTVETIVSLNRGENENKTNTHVLKVRRIQARSVSSVDALRRAGFPELLI